MALLTEHASGWVEKQTPFISLCTSYNERMEIQDTILFA